jgi:hypothetical protein
MWVMLQKHFKAYFKALLKVWFFILKKKGHNEKKNLNLLYYDFHRYSKNPTHLFIPETLVSTILISVALEV